MLERPFEFADDGVTEPRHDGDCCLTLLPASSDRRCRQRDEHEQDEHIPEGVRPQFAERPFSPRRLQRQVPHRGREIHQLDCPAACVPRAREPSWWDTTVAALRHELRRCRIEDLKLLAVDRSCVPGDARGGTCCGFANRERITLPLLGRHGTRVDRKGAECEDQRSPPQPSGRRHEASLRQARCHSRESTIACETRSPCPDVRSPVSRDRGRLIHILGATVTEADGGGFLNGKPAMSHRSLRLMER